jgi:hypothetical protein
VNGLRTPGTATGIGIALVVSAFFLVNLVPFPHASSSNSVTSESVVSGISAHQLSLFGYKTPGIPVWTLTTSDLILIFAAMSFGFDAFFTVKDHL